MLFVLSILLVLLVVSNGLVRSKRSGLRHAVVHLATLPGMDKDGRRGIIKQASLFPEVLDMDRLDEVLYELKDLYPSQFQKFASTLYDNPRQLSKTELQLLARSSFSTEDYLGDILASASRDAGASSPLLLSKPFAVASVLILLFTSLVLPQLEMDQRIKNTVGGIALISPFAVLLLSQIPLDPKNILTKANAAFSLLSKSRSRSESKSKSDRTHNGSGQCWTQEQERVAYHEAGHLLLAYLCGLSVTDYALGDSASTSILSPQHPSDIAVNSGNNNNSGSDIGSGNGSGYRSESSSGRTQRDRGKIVLGNALIVAFGGVVAETLRFGDSKGGKEDIPMALDALRRAAVGSKESRNVGSGGNRLNRGVKESGSGSGIGIGSGSGSWKEKEGYFRWAVGKALSLLRLNRDALDACALQMLKRPNSAADGSGESGSVKELFCIIEST